MAASGTMVSTTIGNLTSSMEIGFIRSTTIISRNFAPLLAPGSYSSPKLSIPNSRCCSVSDSSHLDLPSHFIGLACDCNPLVKDAAASVTRRSISSSGTKKRLLGLWPRSPDSLVAPSSLQASLQPPSEPEDCRADVGSSDNSSSKGSATGLADEKSTSKPQPVANELNKAVRRTAATFAPRASTASKNPAPPGSTLYTVFEAQAYIAMALGGALSFNLLFPSDYPDIWRLMGMWSIWMFTVPSLRARDCSKKEKEALNYLFLVIPLVNITLPILWRSFAAVWFADVLAFFAIYAWKMEWLSQTKNVDDS